MACSLEDKHSVAEILRPPQQRGGQPRLPVVQGGKPAREAREEGTHKISCAFGGQSVHV